MDGEGTTEKQEEDLQNITKLLRQSSSLLWLAHQRIPSSKSYLRGCSHPNKNAWRITEQLLDEIHSVRCQKITKCWQVKTKNTSIDLRNL